MAKKSKSVSPLDGRVKRSSEASDITGRIKRVREAIAAVETQLRTSVLRGRRWENLDQQDQMLTKVRLAYEKEDCDVENQVRSALETLKPRVRRCGQEVEGLSSENTPMEQVAIMMIVLILLMMTMTVSVKLILMMDCSMMMMMVIMMIMMVVIMMMMMTMDCSTSC